MKYSTFTLVTYTGLQPRLRWFKAPEPVTWPEARNRLIDAGIMQAELAGMTRRDGGWMLSVDRNDFAEDKAEPLP